MMAKTLRAAVYGRESKDKTKSVDDQVFDGEAAVDEQGWTHVGTWRDGVSASRHAHKARVGWPEVRGAIDAGLVDVLVLWETSRGSRTLAEWVSLLDTCRDRGVLIHIVSHERTYNPRKAHDRKTLANDGVDAEHEVGRLSERVTRGVASAAAAGGFHGRAPYGYERVIVGERRTSRGDVRPVREQRPDSATAPVVVDIITRVASNESLRSIIKDLDGRGIPAPGGPGWGYDTIHTIVKNRAYLGQRSHKPVNGGPAAVYDGTWEPIVDERIWHTANAVLGDPRRRKAAAPGGLKRLLTVYAKAPCGGALGSHREYGADRYRCTVDACVSVGMAEADEYVIRLVVARMSRKDARRLWMADDEASRKAETELARLEADLKANERDYRLGVISARLAGAREAELEPLIKDAERRAKPATVPLAALELLDAAKLGAERVRPTWDKFPLPAKREIIKGLFTSIVVNPSETRLSRWTLPEERLAIVAERITHEWRKP